MANGMSILIGRKLAAPNTKKSCKIKVDDVIGSREAEVTIRFKIDPSHIEVNKSDVLQVADFARAIFAITDDNLSLGDKEIRASITTEKEAIFLNVSVQLEGTKGKHG